MEMLNCFKTLSQRRVHNRDGSLSSILKSKQKFARTENTSKRKTQYYKLSIPYLTCLGPEMFQIPEIFWILEYLQRLHQLNAVFLIQKSYCCSEGFRFSSISNFKFLDQGCSTCKMFRLGMFNDANQISLSGMLLLQVAAPINLPL